MRSKLLATVLVLSTVVRPSAVVAEPTYTVNTGTKNDSKIVAVIKATFDPYTLPTKEEVAEKEIREYVKKIEAEKRKAAKAKAKKSISVKAVAKPVIMPDVKLPKTACVTAMKKVFPKNLWKVGYAIMKAESGTRPNAIGGPNYNGTYDYGCWQINDSPRALDPLTGTKIAWYKYNHSGWNPWTVYRTGAYLRHF